MGSNFFPADLKDPAPVFQQSSRGIARFPGEILQEIFVHSLPYEGPFMYVRPNASSEPLNLGLVCRAWRQLSITCPRLWASINIDLNRSSPAFRWFKQGYLRGQGLEELGSQFGAGIEQWLGRSGSLPLTIHYREHTEGLLHVRKLLTAVALRWEHVDMDWRGVPLGEWDGLFALLSSESQTPLLRNLILQPRRSNNYPLNFSHLTHLNRLTISSCLPGPKGISIPHQLKHITTDSLNLEQALILFHNCPLLVSAQLCIRFGEATSESGHHDILLRYLEEISIDFLSRDSTAEFWDSLTLPSLKILKVKCNPGVGVPPTHIPSMLIRSRCDLKHLHIVDDLNKEDALECIAVSPNLQKLTLDDIYEPTHPDFALISPILNSLAANNARDDQSVFVPSKLRELSILNCFGLNRYLESLIRFLASRSRVATEATSQTECFEQLEWTTCAHAEKSISFISNKWREFIDNNAELQEFIAKRLHIHLTIGRRKFLYSPNSPEGMCVE